MQLFFLRFTLSHSMVFEIIYFYSLEKIYFPSENAYSVKWNCTHMKMLIHTHKKRTHTIKMLCCATLLLQLKLKLFFTPISQFIYTIFLFIISSTERMNFIITLTVEWKKYCSASLCWGWHKCSRFKRRKIKTSSSFIRSLFINIA